MRPASMLIILFIPIMLCSCDRYGVFDSSINIKDEVWNADSVASFRTTITDTLSAHNIYINIRNSTSYPNSNLFLFVTTTSPSEAVLRDTLEVRLANQRGNWLGRGFGRIRDNQVLYKRNVKIPQPGEYTFQVQHGMRSLNLEGMVSVGIRVERAQ